MSVGPSKNKNKRGLSCPWCPYTGRNDNVKRHMKTGCPNKPEDGESVEAQSCSYNESSQAIEEGFELASQLAGDEFSSINTSEIEQ